MGRKGSVGVRASRLSAAISVSTGSKGLAEIDTTAAFRPAFRDAELSEDDRILLNLLFGRGLTVKEAAARMGIGHDAARQRKLHSLQPLARPRSGPPSRLAGTNGRGGP